MTARMFQVVPCGKGFLFLFPSRFTEEFRESAADMWHDQFPGVPAMFVEYAKLIHLGDGTPMFEFQGDITPAMLAEFRAWWKEVNA